MKNLHRKTAITLLVGVNFWILGCKKFVQIEPPPTLVVSASIFSNGGTATAAVTSIYSQIEGNIESYNSAANNGLLADELTTYSTNSGTLEFYQNAMLAKDVSVPWNNAYNYIYQANAVLSGLQGANGITAVTKKQLSGEAKFIRAFWLFYLSNCYGDIPLVTSSDYTVNETISRSPKAMVYQQVIMDLLDAESLLNPNYIDATDTAVTSERVRPTSWAAAALLGRTYLYAGKYDSAEQQSTLVINNTNLFTLCQSLDSVFLANNTEAIWQIPPTEPSSNPATSDGQIFILTSDPGSGGAGITISPQLMNSFEPGDLRATNWIAAYTDNNNNTYYYPFKYQENQASSPDEYNVMLRLGEQYLIRAEARAQQGNLQGAAMDLNVIRNRAGLANYSGALDGNSLLAAILHERQVELFTEWGHRWFDLNRTNTISSVMSVVTPLKGGGAWNANMALYPIPKSELASDPNLVQNQGYQ